MNGWSPKKITILTQPGASETDTPLTDAITLTAGGALNFRINISATVTAGQLTAQLQQKINSSWVDLTSANSDVVITTATGDSSIKMSAFVAADQPDLPLGSALRLVATTDASWDGTIDSVQMLQDI